MMMQTTRFCVWLKDTLQGQSPPGVRTLWRKKMRIWQTEIYITQSCCHISGHISFMLFIIVVIFKWFSDLDDIILNINGACFFLNSAAFLGQVFCTLCFDSRFTWRTLSKQYHKVGSLITVQYYDYSNIILLNLSMLFISIKHIFSHFNFPIHDITDERWTQRIIWVS